MDPSEQLARSQVADEDAIGGEKVIAGQLAQRAPAQVVKDAVGHFAGKLVDNEKLQVDRTAAAVGMAGVRHAVADIGGDT
jgi:hypothetical protein